MDGFQVTVIGDKSVFAIGYHFFPVEGDADSCWPMNRCTGIRLFISGADVMGFTRNGRHVQPAWDFDELVEWLDDFARNSREEPFPYPDVPGNSLADLDYNARDFDSNDDEEFDRYYATLNDWIWSHSWLHARSGAIIPDILFRVLGSDVELSWDNREAEEGVRFDSERGSALVPLATFRDVVSRFVAAYLRHWGGYAWDRVQRQPAD